LVRLSFPRSSAHSNILPIQNRHQKLRLELAIPEDGFAQNSLALKPEALVNMLRTRIGLENIQPEPMSLQLVEYVIEDGGEHKPAQSAVRFCHDDSLQSNGPMWRCEPAQNGESGYLSRFRFRDKIAAIRAGYSRAMLIFRPLSNKRPVIRDTFELHDRRDVIDPCRPELHACDDNGPR
jgi:hypothetical protein